MSAGAQRTLKLMCARVLIRGDTALDFFEHLGFVQNELIPISWETLYCHCVMLNILLRIVYVYPFPD